MGKKEQLMDCVQKLSVIIHTETREDSLDLGQVLDLSFSDKLQYIKTRIQELIRVKKLVQENQHYQEYNQYQDYQELMQKYEGEVRKHIQIQYVLKISSDDLDLKLELKNQEIRQILNSNEEKIKEMKEEIQEIRDKTTQCDILIENSKSKLCSKEKALQEIRNGFHNLDKSIKRLNIKYNEKFKLNPRLQLQSTTGSQDVKFKNLSNSTTQAYIGPIKQRKRYLSPLQTNISKNARKTMKRSVSRPNLIRL